MAFAATVLVLGCGAVLEPDPCATDAPQPAGATVEVVAGGTEMTATFLSLSCDSPPSSLTFRVAMTNHSGVPGWENDLLPWAVVVTGDGLDMSDGLTWENHSRDDHHPLGVLSAPAVMDGTPVLGCETESISLRLTGLGMADGEEAVFAWTGAVLQPLRACP